MAAVLSCGSSGDGECNPRPTAECPERPDDETGYAALVCQYAVQNGYDYPDVAALNIVNVERGSVAGAGSEYGTDRYDWARLDCCFAGDIAVIDTAECKVVEIYLAPSNRRLGSRPSKHLVSYRHARGDDSCRRRAIGLRL